MLAPSPDVTFARSWESPSGTAGSATVAVRSLPDQRHLALSAPGSFFAYVWDGKRQFTNAAGKVRRQEVPAGPYRLQLIVTKALADPANPAHVETWTSGVLSIVR